VKIAKQKNAVFCLAHAACGGAPGLSARRPVRCLICIFKRYSVPVSDCKNTKYNFWGYFCRIVG
jgi:hypothetical protein